MSLGECAGERDQKSASSQELLNLKGNSNLESLLINKSKPFKMGPSTVLGRVKDFLPHLEHANQELQKKIAEGTAEELDIENVEECEGPIIEMNLALFQDERSSDEDDEDGESSECESDEHSDQEQDSAELLGEVTTESLRLPHCGTKRKGKKALIEELKKDSTERNQPMS